MLVDQKETASSSSISVLDQLNHHRIPICHSSYFLSSTNESHVSAARYLQQHHIAELMKSLSAQLLLHQPKDPQEFLATRCMALKEQPHHITHIVQFDSQQQEIIFKMVPHYTPGNEMTDNNKCLMIKVADTTDPLCMWMCMNV